MLTYGGAIFSQLIQAQWVLANDKMDSDAIGCLDVFDWPPAG